MRVLLAHVRYRFPGGEEATVEHELDLLQSAGVDARLLEVQAPAVNRLTVGQGLGLVTRYSDHAYGRGLIGQAIAAHDPDVVHFHNVMPLLGAGSIREARERGCAIVRTIHNYRYSCLEGMHVYDGHPCFECSPCRLGTGVVRGCYRGSRSQSFLAARAACTLWSDACGERGPHLQLFVTPPMRDTCVSFGLDAQRCVFKPNSVAASTRPHIGRDDAVFVGRLSEEKGIRELLASWNPSGPPLRIAGDGPLREDLQRSAPDNVVFLGRLSPDDVRRLLASSGVLVMPSIGPEGFPLTLLESFAEGTPAVAFKGTALADALASVDPDLLVPEGDCRALASAAARVLRMGAEDWETRSRQARTIHEERFSDGANLLGLLAAYSEALRLRDESKCGD